MFSPYNRRAPDGRASSNESLRASNKRPASQPSNSVQEDLRRLIAPDDVSLEMKKGGGRGLDAAVPKVSRTFFGNAWEIDKLCLVKTIIVLNYYVVNLHDILHDKNTKIYEMLMFIINKEKKKRSKKLMC